VSLPTESKPQLMHEHIREKCELAVAYAEDGAYVTALRILSLLKDETAAHVRRLKSQGIL
jgi:hypothetical protein